MKAEKDINTLIKSTQNEDDNFISSLDEHVETIFKVEPPLMQIKEGKGFGFMGVMLRNTVEDKLQCHICGVWRKGLSTHTNQAHQISADEYRKKFQLPLTFPLVSLSTSQKHSDRANTKKNLDHLNKVRNIEKLNNVSRKKRQRFMRYARNNLAFQNQRALCEEQLERRFLIVADIVGKEPSQIDLIKYDCSLWGAIRRRFGTINEFRRKNNYEIKKRAKVFSDEKLLSCIIKFYHQHKIIPRPSHFKGTKPNIETFRNHFGSWNRALSLCGFDKIAEVKR
ncbi:MAG: MucR family transcriptional regulator [Candidatus Omnitrophica bacterium]|nr:MucR family transcriptional regulator [Candidatus Omnitrophota bacterium]